MCNGRVVRQARTGSHLHTKLIYTNSRVVRAQHGIISQWKCLILLGDDWIPNWKLGVTELDSGECHLRIAPTFSQMSRTDLKPGLRPGFGWCWYTQQLFDAPFGIVHVLESRSHSENMSGKCQKYHIAGNLVAVFKKFSHLKGGLVMIQSTR